MSALVIYAICMKGKDGNRRNTVLAERSQ